MLNFPWQLVIKAELNTTHRIAVPLGLWFLMFLALILFLAEVHTCPCKCVQDHCCCWFAAAS